MNHSKNSIWYILAVSAILHGLIIYFSNPFNNYDINSWYTGGKSTLEGINIYPMIATRTHPYFPLFLYLEAIALFFSTKLFTQIIILKIIFSFFNLGVVYLVYLFSKKNVFLTALYAYNPISLLVTCFHGQFDSIPVFLILLSIYFVQKKKTTLPLLILSTAIALKTWPILFCIPILKYMKKKFTKNFLFNAVFLLSTVPAIMSLIYMFFFHANPLMIAKVLISYGGVTTVWGLSKGIYLILGNNKIIYFILKIIFVSLLLVFQWKTKDKSIFSQLYFAIVLFFVIASGFGIQYFYWIVPFALLSKKSNWSIYLSILCSIVITYMVFSGMKIPSLVYESIYFMTWVVLSLHFLDHLIFPLFKSSHFVNGHKILDQ